jgi:hypothetical protein
MLLMNAAKKQQGDLFEFSIAYIQSAPLLGMISVYASLAVITRL